MLLVLGKVKVNGVKIIVVNLLFEVGLIWFKDL